MLCHGASGIPSMNVFEPEAAVLWKLKGQGNANAVFAYAGTDPDVAQHVLRVRKEKLPENTHSEASQVLAELEKEVWEGIITDWTSGAAVQEQYKKQVLRPLLGGKYIHHGQYMHLPQLFAAALGQHCDLQLSQDAWIVQDHTVFQQRPPLSLGGPSSASPCDRSTLCLELKPKCGFLPSSHCVHPQHKIKLQVSRYQLHQQLKLAQGKVKQRSTYNPLDLFSGDSLRMQQALTDLLACPQNNLRLFIDGEPVAENKIVEKLYEASTPYGGSAKLLSKVIMILQHTGVLMKVLEAQMLEAHDVEGIKVLLDHLIGNRYTASSDGLKLTSALHDSGSCRDAMTVSEAMSICEDLAHEGQRGFPKSLLGLDRAAALRQIRNYLTAATAKDLSIMLTLRKAPRHTSIAQSNESAGGHPASVAGPALVADVLTDGTSGTEFKVALVDLDIKPLRKIYDHWRLDEDIMRVATMSSVQHQKS